MKALFRSAAYRMAFACSFTFALATLLLGGAVYYAAHAALARQMDSSIVQAANGLMAEYGDDGIAGLSEAIGQREGRGPDALGYALFDHAGNRIGGQLNTKIPPIGWHRISFIDPIEGPDPARALVRPLAGGFRLVVAADLEPVEQIDHTILSLFAAAFGVLLLIGVGGAFLLGSYLRSRLSRIELTAAAIVDGDLTRRMAISPRNDEFDRLAASLNAMLDRIGGLITNLRQVTSDLAHDLRTPLMRLRNQLEGLHAAAESPERRDEVDRAVGRADEVLQLFEAILRISELEEGSLRKGFASVDLCRLVAELGDSHFALAEDAGQVLQVETGTECFVEGDRELLAQALINLIENALRHTPRGSTITIGTRGEAGHVVGFVRDNGPGIPADDRKRACERFVRLEASRSTPGHGLGLSLVQAVATVHGASLTMHDIAGGFEVALVFPAVTRP